MLTRSGRVLLSLNPRRQSSVSSSPSVSLQSSCSEKQISPSCQAMFFSGYSTRCRYRLRSAAGSKNICTTCADEVADIVSRGTAARRNVAGSRAANAIVLSAATVARAERPVPRANRRHWPSQLVDLRTVNRFGLVGRAKSAGKARAAAQLGISFDYLCKHDVLLDLIFSFHLGWPNASLPCFAPPLAGNSHNKKINRLIG